LGGVDPQSIASYAEMLADLEEELGNSEKMEGEGGRSNYFLLDVYLSWVVKVIEEEGWLSRGKAYEDHRTSTADRAINDMFPSGKYRPERPTEKHVQKAKAALAWAEENLHGRDDLNDYLYNVKVVTSTRAINFKMTGIAASLIPLFDRETQKGKDVVNSQHIGNVRDKIKFTGTCTFVQGFESQFGFNWLFTFLTDDGNIVKTYSKSLNVQRGNKVEMQAKVKGHTEWKGQKQTEVNYAKVLRVIEEE
jgi:hypothetical protein